MEPSPTSSRWNPEASLGCVITAGVFLLAGIVYAFWVMGCLDMLLWIAALMVPVASLVLMFAWTNGRQLPVPLPWECPECGYDVRESPDICPECGEERAGAMFKSLEDSTTQTRDALQSRAVSARNRHRRAAGPLRFE